jgi:hypothetical protein
MSRVRFRVSVRFRLRFRDMFWLRPRAWVRWARFRYSVSVMAWAGAKENNSVRIRVG